MDFQTTITIIFAAFAIAEVLQVFMLRAAVMQIKDKMEKLMPEGYTAGQALSDAAIQFMHDIQTDPEKAQIVGAFVRGSAVAAWDEIKGKVPLLGGGGIGDTNEMMEKIAKKNPWAGLILTGLQLASPMIQQKAAEMQQQKPSQKKAGTGGRAYG